MPRSQSVRPLRTRELIELRAPMSNGPVASIVSGETKPTAAIAPAGRYSGKKKLKTEGDSNACMPRLLGRPTSSSSREASGRYSMARSKCISLSNGSRRPPWVGAASAAAERASRSSRIAAAVAPKSPYEPL
eukprot:4198497-Prymnesium_polylepis.2